MRLHLGMERLPEIPSPVVTVGSFDGVHIGHRAIIDRLNILAEKCGGQSVLITFHPHPRKVLFPEGKGRDLQLISSREEKIIQLEQAGLDHLIILEFTMQFSRITSEDFVRDLLHSRLRAHTVVVGFNHYFGHNREGDFQHLYEWGQEMGFQVEEIPEQELHNETVSSTKIRKALKEGNIQRANACLDHLYMIKAPWQHRPDETANYGQPAYQLLISEKDKLLPPDGAYAVALDSEQYRGKGLVLIKGQEVMLFILDSFLTGDRLEGAARFQKRIPEIDRSLDAALDAVRELIY